MPSTIPLVVYTGHQRIVVGEIEVQEKGDVKGSFVNKDVVEMIARNTNWNLVLMPVRDSEERQLQEKRFRGKRKKG